MHSHTEIHLRTLEQIVYCLCGQVRSCIDVSSQCTVPWWSPTRNHCTSKRPRICCIINSQPYAVTAVVVLLHWLLNSLWRAKNLSGKWARSEACTHTVHTCTNTHCNTRKLIRRILRMHQFAGHTRNFKKKKAISCFLSSKIAIACSLLILPYSQLTSSHDYAMTHCAVFLALASFLSLVFFIPPPFIHRLTQCVSVSVEFPPNLQLKDCHIWVDIVPVFS